VLAAKGLTGIALALSQGLLFLILTGGLGRSWPAVLLLLLLASGMASAMGMIAGSAGRDFMATLFLGIVLIVPLLIPAFAVIFPVGAAPWTKALPSYGLIGAMVETVGYGKGWGAVLPRIAAAAAWTAAMFVCALAVLRRKVEVL
jgi:ABC-2 type transport system permease protein